MKSREVASSYNCDIVLADLGTSHFKQSTADQQDTSDQDTHGTYSYGKLLVLSPSCTSS